MDSKSLSSILCLVFVLGTAKGCVDLVEDFLIVRDGILRKSLCKREIRDLESAEDYLGFPLTSDQCWRSLLCDVAGVDDLSDLHTVLNEHSEGTIDKDTILTILIWLQDHAEWAPKFIEFVGKYQHKVQPWLAKTNFPHAWPVENTGKKETARIMAKGHDQFNLITFDSYNPNPDYIKWAKALINADSLEDYLAVVDEDLIEETEIVQCYMAIQDVFRDTGEFGVMQETGWAYVRFVNHLNDIGLMVLSPEHP